MSEKSDLVKKVEKFCENPIINKSGIAKQVLKTTDQSKIIYFTHKLAGRNKMKTMDALKSIAVLEAMVMDYQKTFNKVELSPEPWNCECKKCGSKFLSKDLKDGDHCPTANCEGKGSDIIDYNAQ